MSQTLEDNNSISNSSLYEILKNCAELQSYETLDEECHDEWYIGDNNGCKMISNLHSTNGNLSRSSYTSNESFADNILEENGRISLAYENLRTIPRRLADKFAGQTKFLDLSYNNFQNLSFLTFFEDLHTLILDRNTQLDANSLPFLLNLEILWINNCGITKVTDWVLRIQKQCPALKHLSIMGNPGTKGVFNYCSSHTIRLQHEPLPTAVSTDCREYILNMLPNLKYLDGIPRIHSCTHQISRVNDKNLYTGSSTNPSGLNGSSISDHRDHISRTQTSPTLSFKNLFRLQRRKKSYQSSSTN